MLSGLITTAITALLAFLGVEPSAALVGGIFVAVKITVMAVIGLISWRALKKKQREGRVAAPVAPSPATPDDAGPGPGAAAP